MKRSRMARAEPGRAQELIDIAAAGIADEIISEVLGAGYDKKLLQGDRVSASRMTERSKRP
jgi:hypothetical protein